MAHNYTPVPTYHATVPLPDDGDPAIAASVNGPLEDVADGLAYGVAPMANGGTIVLGGTLTFAGGLVEFDQSLRVTGGSVLIDVDSFFNEDVTLGSSVADAITVNGTLLVNNNMVVGTSAGDVFLITATSTFNGPVSLNGAVTVDAAATLEVDGAATFDGTVTFTDDVAIGNGGTDSLDVLSTTLFRSSVTIGNDSGTELLTVNAPSTFEDSVTFNDDVTIDASASMICGGGATFTNDVTLGNSTGDAVNILGACSIVSLANAMGFGGGGAGRVPWRPVILPNSNTVYTTASGNVFFARSGTITATRQFEWTDVSAVDGDWIMVLASNCGTSIELTVDGSFFAAVPGTVNALVLFVRVSGTWYKAVEIEV